MSRSRYAVCLSALPPYLVVLDEKRSADSLQDVFFARSSPKLCTCKILRNGLKSI